VLRVCAALEAQHNGHEAFYLHVHSFSTLSAKQTHSGAQNQFGMRSFANRDYALYASARRYTHLGAGKKCVLLIE